MIKILPLNNSKVPLHLRQLANHRTELIQSTNKGEKMKRGKDDGYFDYLKKARMALAEEQFEDALKFYDQPIGKIRALILKLSNTWGPPF